MTLNPDAFDVRLKTFTAKPQVLFIVFSLLFFLTTALWAFLSPETGHAISGAKEGDGDRDARLPDLRENEAQQHVVRARAREENADRGRGSGILSRVGVAPPVPALWSSSVEVKRGLGAGHVNENPLSAG